jgi:hypothetical protein
VPCVLAPALLTCTACFKEGEGQAPAFEGVTAAPTRRVAKDSSLPHVGAFKQFSHSTRHQTQQQGT